MSKDVKELMEEAGITQDHLDAARSTESAFLHYLIHGRPVFVEVIAPNLVETLLQLPYDDQAKFMAVILNLVPDVGDQEVIVDDHGDGKKRRGARVIRMKSERDKFINLLITR